MGGAKGVQEERDGDTKHGLGGWRQGIETQKAAYHYTGRQRKAKGPERLGKETKCERRLRFEHDRDA